MELISYILRNKYTLRTLKHAVCNKMENADPSAQSCVELHLEKKKLNYEFLMLEEKSIKKVFKCLHI